MRGSLALPGAALVQRQAGHRLAAWPCDCQTRGVGVGGVGRSGGAEPRKSPGTQLHSRGGLEPQIWRFGRSFPFGLYENQLFSSPMPRIQTTS